MTSDPVMGLRERTRLAVRAELMTAAMDLFAADGFDGVTVDRIAAAAGISSRSFFRYFPSKEDVVLGNLEAVGVAIADRLATRPDGEPAWLALRRAFDLVVERNGSDRERALTLMRMLAETPSLKARHLEKQGRWQDLLVPHVVVRLPQDPERDEFDARAQAIVGSALACLDAAQAQWTASGGHADLAVLLDQTMSAVAPFATCA